MIAARVPHLLSAGVTLLLFLPGPYPIAPPGSAAISRLAYEEWTPRFVEMERAGQWAALAAQLDAIHGEHPDLYEAWRLGYLQARALFEAARLDDAARAFDPFLAPGHPLRDLALHYRARIAEEQNDEDEAARLREELVVQYPQTPWRSAALADLAGHVQARGTAAQMQELAARLAPTLDAARRRDLEARRIEMLQAAGDGAQALALGLPLLKEEAADDAAERTARALDHPDLVKRMAPEDWVLLGESLRAHRHFDRAADLLAQALDRVPARREDVLFALGRAHFGAERYAEAEKQYLKGAAGARTGDAKALFYHHASRAAQLQGDDARAEQQMGLAIKAAASVAPARKPARRGRRRPVRTSLAAAAGATPGPSAVVQRLRTRLFQKRYADAEGDLRTAVQRYPREAAGDATLAFAVALLAAGRADAALGKLQTLARPSDPYAAAEVAYWRACALEAGDPGQALREYLQVLRSPVPTHFAYFARRRLADPAFAPSLAADLQARAAEVDRLVAAGDFDAARPLQTDVVLLAPAASRAAEVQKLRAIYEKLPRYREVLELKPLDFPRFPLPAPPPPESVPPGAPTPAGEPQRLDLLLAMGLFDDAVDLVPVRWGLGAPASALTRSLALHLGAAPRGSIYAVEALMRTVPDDYVPDLLPRDLRQLLYPRYFYDRVVAESKKHGADPRLVISLMREESRFDPRAKSAASARGLLQFVIMTARDVGRALGLVDLDPQDLYDPAIVIQLGAKYAADLAKEFDGDPYRTVAAYNAGPNQVKLWWRLTPLPRADAFFSSISFDETRNYVRKVLNSYARYGEIYDQAGPAGGLRVAP